jgi:hypothetical protein
MNPGSRTLLGKNAGLMSRGAVYETAEAVEEDSHVGYEVNRRRVLYEEVLLVTIHRETGTSFIVFNALTGLFFAGMALKLQVIVPGLGIAFGILAVPFVATCIFRLIFKPTFVSVFGRRSKAVMRFSVRKRRAREVYGRICSRTREVQRVTELPATP